MDTVEGDERTTKSKVLETGAALTQDFAPVKSICAHLNAFHVYADDPKRFVEANHYCSHLTEGMPSARHHMRWPIANKSGLPADVRQCILYDSPNPGARLIGIEYMITPKLYETLDAQERKLWHSHVFEVKSGMLIMPQPSVLVPQAAWEKAETAEMQDVIELYGKVYHLWQVDKGHKIPLGEPKLMTSFTQSDQMPEFDKIVGERDARFGSDWRRKKEIRQGIKEPSIHPDADASWT